MSPNKFNCPAKNCFHQCSSAFELKRHIAKCPKRRRSSCTEGCSGAQVPELNTSTLDADTSLPLPEIEHIEESLAVGNSENATGSRYILDSPLSSVNGSLLEVLLCIAERGEARNVERILSLLRTDLSSIQNSIKHVTTIPQLRAVVKETAFQEMESFGFVREEVVTPCNTWCGTVFKRNPIRLLEQQIQAWNEYNTLGKHNAYAIHTETVRKIRDYIKLRTISHSSEPWIEEGPFNKRNRLSIVGFVQLFTDKTTTALGSAGIDGYPAHVVMMNFPTHFMEWCIRHGLTCTGFLPVSTEMVTPHSSERPRFPTGEEERSVRMGLLHAAVERILEPLSLAACNGFPVDLDGPLHVRCHPVLFSFCCDIPEAKDMTALKHGSRTAYGCHRCMWLSGSRRKGISRNVYLTHRLRSQLLNPSSTSSSTDGINSQFGSGSVHKWVSFLERSPLVLPCHIHGLYQCFGFEMLHNFDLGVSRTLKAICQDFFANLTPTHTIPRHAGGRLYISKVMNDYLAEVDMFFPIPGMNVSISKEQSNGRRDGLFAPHGLRGMLEGKYFRNLDIVFPMLCSTMDKLFGKGDEAPFTKIHTTYTDIVLECVRGPSGVGEQEYAENIAQNVHHFKNMVQTYISHLEPKLLRMLKYHLFDHVHEDVTAFGDLRRICAAVMEYSHVLFKRSYARTSKRKRTALGETIAHYEYDVGELSTEKYGGPPLPRGNEECTFPRLNKELKVADVMNNPEILQEVAVLTSDECFDIVVQLRIRGIVDSDKLQAVRTGYINNTDTPTLEDVDWTSTRVRCPAPQAWKRERIYCAKEFGPSRAQRYSTLGYKVQAEGSMRYVQFGQAVLFARIEHEDGKRWGNVVVLEALPLQKPKNEADRTLRCILVQAPLHTRRETRVRNRKLIIVPLEDVVCQVYLTPAFIQSGIVHGDVFRNEQFAFVNRFTALNSKLR